MMKKVPVSLLFLFLGLIIIFPLLSAKKIGAFTEKQSTIAFLKKERIKQDRAEFLQQRLKNEIQRYFYKAIANKSIVGAAVSIVQCDSVLLKEGYGRRKITEPKKIDHATVFRLGSLSKGFAGILAGIEVEKGNLNWNSKVVDFIPNFKVKGTQRTQKINLTHVLSQSTGLPYHSFTNLVEDGVAMQKVAKEFDKLNFVAEPGKIYSYQNAMYAMSGLMIEASEQKPLAQVLQEKIFGPLQMTTASATYKDLMKEENIAYPHRKRYGRFKTRKINNKYYNAVAAGGINASANDMANWMRFLLGSNQEVLSSQGIQEVFQPQVKIPGKHKYYQKWKGHQSSAYAFGWRIHNFKDRKTNKVSKVIHHGGTVSSYRTEIALFPEEDLGISVLFNCTTRLARTVIPDLKKIVRNVLSTPIPEMDTNTPAIL
ncbi:beta-lactamase family protein [Aquimarina sp. ERC-38]|uniref:serine hydrolase domain-containing protein n=1 Tax=Aquimarina sp. ERC-38 TaxID=2949996 RepID=UPI00224864F7|nr:serine hydrolase domain-containing protein [Aquimarina sp. ERC-38]UZO81289.1 beta-lactamase family protein [Aquimarina sp. ERC-38]